MNSEFRRPKPEAGTPADQRAPARSFEQLIVWQKAHQLVLAARRFTGNFPRKGTCGPTSQLRRAVVAIPANIAAGVKKRSRADNARFLNLAQGSLEEGRCSLILARDLNCDDTTGLVARFAEVGKLLEVRAAKILTSDSCL
ncbi:MAG TPA: four helix bundle protein [Verrucomicrobiota bacterium]|nr:four helix bundle protein [Verrucomicrobiota bacterium]HNT15295.1 four helix bundle protein [Verrucomicrobiota bacterium]